MMESVKSMESVKTTVSAKAIGGKKLRLGEGPVWDSRRKVLFYVDIEGKEIGCYNPETEEHTYLKTEKMPGCIVLDEEGNLISAEKDMLARICPETGERKWIAAFDIPEGMRFNDGKCDCRGRLWVGTMAMDQKASYAAGGGGLYRYEEGKAKMVLKGLTIPNGIAVNSYNTCFYHVDTPTRQIGSYAFDAERGTLADRQTAVRIECPGNPDGMTIDCQGMLWVALWGGYAVVRYDPGTGRELQRIALPDKNVSCCTFGGAEMDTLYITTAQDEEGHGGHVYECKVGVKGAEPDRFR